MGISIISVLVSCSHSLQPGVSLFSSLNCQSLPLSCSQSHQSGVSLFSSLSCHSVLVNFSQSLQCGLLAALSSAPSSVSLSSLPQPLFLFVRCFSSTAGPFSCPPTSKSLFFIPDACCRLHHDFTHKLKNSQCGLYVAKWSMWLMRLYVAKWYVEVRRHCGITRVCCKNLVVNV